MRVVKVRRAWGGLAAQSLEKATRLSIDMKLCVTVEFGKQSASFDIPVGDGQKTVKWLATVASQRFSARGPHGRLRTREPLMAQSQGSAYMPSSVTTEDTSFFHPDALLAEVMHDAQQVLVTLAPKIPVDEIGHTMMSRWAIIAFANSESQRILREQALKEEYSIQEEQRREREEREAATRAAEQKFKATEMRSVVAVQLHDEEKIAEALMEDWYNMNRKSMIDNWVKSPSEQKKLKELFGGHYVQLSELFKTYGAAGSAMGTTHEMEYLEFSQFCNDVSIFDDVKNSQELMSAAFRRGNCYLEATGDEREAMNSSLDRPGFFNALIQLALMKFTEDEGESKPKPGRGGGKTKHRSTLAGAGSNQTGPVSEHMMRMIHEFILPLISKRLVGAMVKHALNSDDVLAMVSAARNDNTSPPTLISYFALFP